LISPAQLTRNLIWVLLMESAGRCSRREGWSNMIYCSGQYSCNNHIISWQYCVLSIRWCTCIINMMRVSFSQGFLTIIESKLASIQIKYMIKFVSDLQQVSGFLWVGVLWFLLHFCRTIFVDIADTTIPNLIYV
jgi:hypothetical protein